MRVLGVFLIVLLSACSSMNNKSTGPAENKAAREKISELSAQITKLCTNPDYAAYFAKTFCTPADATLVIMSEKTKINIAEKNALNAWSQAYDKLADEVNTTLRTAGPKEKLLAEYIDTVAIPAAQKSRLELYNGEITWGQYSLRRKEIIDGIAVESRRIFQ